MNDALYWPLVDLTSGSDYGVFKTQHAERTHPMTGRRQRFAVVECGDWANVIALTSDRRIVLVSQFRAGSSQVELEIPGGAIDAGEDALTAAKRELLEETGFGGGAWHALGVCNPNPALFTNRLHTYLAVDVEQLGEPTLDEGEVLKVSTQPLSDVIAELRSGTIHHALVFAAFAHLAVSTRWAHLAAEREPWHNAP